MSSSDYRVAASAWLEQAAALPPAGWYATPMSGEAAAAFARAMHLAGQRVLAGGGDAWRTRLGGLIGQYWSGGAVELDFRSLAVTAPPEAKALVELVYGQLLVSRKRSLALQHLDRGFAMLAGGLSPVDYFALLERHALLRMLTLTDAGAAPLDLPDLLVEARVIRRLRDGGRAAMPRPLHDDTLG